MSVTECQGHYQGQISYFIIVENKWDIFSRAISVRGYQSYCHDVQKMSNIGIMV